MEQDPQLALDFEQEEQKLKIANAISEKCGQIEGGLTPQHFASLIERACFEAMDGDLSEETSDAIKKYVQGLESRSDLDATRIVNIIFAEDESRKAA